MPVRNVVRYQAADTNYHVYNRGHNASKVFVENDDYLYFEFLLQRCFGPKQLKTKDNKLFPWFGDKVSLVAFCLMPNHFHLLLYQGDHTTALSKAMQSLATTYSMYFNRKYGRRGSIFESVFKSCLVANDSYLLHITRYIHLNPKDHKHWRYSSYGDYINRPRDWVKTNEILTMFDSSKEYEQFMDDYKDLKNEIDDLKYQLADYATTH